MAYFMGPCLPTEEQGFEEGIAKGAENKQARESKEVEVGISEGVGIVGTRGFCAQIDGLSPDDGAIAAQAVKGDLLDLLLAQFGFPGTQRLGDVGDHALGWFWAGGGDLDLEFVGSDVDFGGVVA